MTKTARRARGLLTFTMQNRFAMARALSVIRDYWHFTLAMHNRFAIARAGAVIRDYWHCSHFWLPTVQDVLHADWHEVWHSPQPPFFSVFCNFLVFKVFTCFIIISPLSLFGKIPSIFAIITQPYKYANIFYSFRTDFLPFCLFWETSERIAPTIPLRIHKTGVVHSIVSKEKSPPFTNRVHRHRRP